MTKSSTIKRSQMRTTRQLGFMLLLTLAILLPSAMQAQVASYTFAEGTQTYTNLTAPTVLGTATANTNAGSIDDVVYTIADGAFPFPFSFGGVPYTGCKVNTNGYITFGATLPFATDYTPISGAAAYNGAIAIWARDINSMFQLGSLTGTISWGVEGTAPNREIVIQWQDYRPVYTNNTTDVFKINFQIRLLENGNLIKFNYGPSGVVLGAPVFSGTNQVGLRGATNADFVNRTSTTSWTGTAAGGTNASTMNITNTILPANGTLYTWTPPPACVAPTSLAASINLTPVNVATINGSFTAAPTAPSGYVVVRTATNVQPVLVNGTTYTVGTNPVGYIEYVGTTAGSWTSSGLTANTAYYYWVFSYNNAACLTTAYSTIATTSSAFTPACAFPPGTYTVGATGMLTSLTSASANLAACAQSGAYVFELLNDYNPASETYPIVFPNLAISSSTNTITIRPATGSTASITSANTTGTLRLDGLDWLILDGRPGGTGTPKTLVVENTSTSGFAIQLINDATNDKIQYATVRSTNTSTASGTIVFGTTTGASGNDNNIIDNCDIKDGATTPANGIYSVGSTTTAATNNSNNTVSNTNIYNFFAAGTASNGITVGSGNTDWTINANHFYQTATRTGTTGSTHIAINISNTSGNNFSVTNNFIGGSAINAGGTPWTVAGTVANRFIGINASVGTTTASNIQGNTIANFTFASSSGATTLPAVWGGIYVPSGSANIGTTTGNTIGNTSTGSIAITSSTTAALSMGIGCASGSGSTVNISNNSVGSINTIGSTATVSHGFNGIWTTGALTALTINNNTVGNTSMANSINAITASTSGSAQSIVGILNSGAATTLSITNNTVANINNAYVPSSANTSAIIRGIVNSSGSGVISGNTVRNLSTAANATGTTTAASVIGISQSSTTAPMSITQNTVYALSNANTGANAVQVIGIYSSGPTSAYLVNRNNVHSLSTASTSATAEIRGISIAGGTGTYQNNMVRVGVDNLGAAVSAGVIITGIYDVSGTNNIYHNTVYVGGTGVAGSAATYAFRSDVTTNVRAFVNNIFVNVRANGVGTGKHYAVRLAGAAVNPAGLTSNYNIYQATGTGGVFGFFNGADVANLAAWQTAVGKDANSIYADPCLNNPAGATPDLHLTNCSGAGSPANAAGTVVAAVTVDYDNETRSSLSPVDIGADAGLYGPSGLDLIATSLATPTPGGCKGPAEVVSVNITNNSTNPIDFSVDNATVTVTATGGYSSSVVLTSGTLAPGASQVVTLPATINMSASGTYVFNGNVSVTGDALPANNAFAATTITTLTMGGAYTVGVGGNYTTLTAAVADYNITSCITAPIIFNLTDATYPTETFPIVINNNAQASSTLTLTIKPNTGATTLLTGANATSLITFNGARYVTVDGSNNGSTSQNLTIRNKSVAPTIVFINDAVNDGVKNSIVEGVNTGASSGTILFSTSTGTLGNSNNLISGNNIRERADSTIVPANAIYGSGSGTALNANNSIINNNIFNFTAAGVAITGTGVGDNWTINGNSIYQTAARTTALTGISLLGGRNGHNVNNNFFGGTAPSAGGTNLQTTLGMTAITVAAGTTTVSNIQGNTIKNIRSTISAYTNSYAIYFQSGLGNISNNYIGSTNVAERIEMNGDNRYIFSSSAAATVIDNNTINNVTTATTPAPQVGEWYYGIYIDGAGNQIVSNNTITNFTNTSVPSASFNTETRGIYVGSTGAPIIRGNNLYNYGNTAGVVNPTTAKTFITWGIHVNTATTAATVIEKNKISDLYGTSPTTGAWADLILGIQTSTGANGTISNNMINLNGGTNPNDRAIYALYETSGGAVNYYFNTANVSGTATGGTNNTYAFVRNATTTVNVKDNLFSNLRTGGTGFHVAMGNAVAATGWSASASDYNNVYNVDNTHVTQWLGINAAANRTLAAFRTSTGGDLNSKNIAPVYVSATDLHLQVVLGNSPLVDAGVAISGITTDIDNAVRSTIPDIGADEFADRPATPAAPTQDVTPPSCTGGTTLFAATPPSGILWFWQTTATDTSMTYPSTTPYSAPTNGVYYLRAYDPILNLWSLNASSITITNVPTAVLPPSPTATTPSCLNTTITVPAPTDPNVTYYWQGTNSTGTSMAQNASTPLTVSISGTYYVAAYDASSGCWSNTNGIAVVIDPTVPAAPSVGPNIARCQGAASAIITGLAPGSSTVTWWDASSNGNQLGSGSPFQTVGTSLLPNTNTPAVYTFYAQSNSVACTSAARVAVTVTINALPSVDAGTAHSVCPGYTTLSGSGATTYTWDNGVTNGAPFVINNTTTYTVTGTDGNGCTNQDTVTLFVLPATPVNITPTGPITTCQNQPVTLTANGPAPGPEAVITQWNFNGASATTVPGGENSPTPSVGAGTASLVGGVTSPATFVSGSANGGSSDPVLTTPANYAWNTTGYPAQGVAPHSAGVQFNVSTVGYSNIKFMFDNSNSNTAANKVLVQYNADVTQPLSPWLNAGSFITSVGATFQNARLLDLSSFPATNNNANLGIRIVTDTTGGAGNYMPTNVGSTYGTGGTIRYDMVTFSGQPSTVSYSWNPGGATTQTYTPNTVGTFFYRVTATQPGVCPGVDSVSVTINPIFTTTINPIICGNQTYPIFGQGTVNQTGIYTENRTSVKGCDSTVIVNLTVNPVYNNTIPNVTICSNQTYTLANGNVVSTAGTYTRTVPTIKGCDSTVTVTIIVKPAQLINVSQAICTGSSYTLPNGTSVNVAGTYTNTFPAANGCDSTIVTTITLKPVFTSTQNVAICQGDVHTMPNGTTQGTAGTYTFPFTAVNGCDSTITVNLTVNPIYTTNVAVDLCPGETYTLANGTVISTAGTHAAIVNTINGCDSTVIVTATARQNYANNVTASICQGGSYTLVNGANVTTAGTYVSGTQTIYGCDSVVTVTLSINPVYNQTASASICQGETFTFPDGTTGTTSGAHTSNLTSSKGCDSTIVTTLTVNPLPNVNLGSNIAVLNPPVTLNAGVGFSSYLWSTNATTQTIVVTQNGTYSVTVTNQFGCEASDEIQVNFLTSVTELGKNGGNINLFPNPTSERFSINVNGYVDGGDLRIDIINAVGQVVSTEMMNNVTESFTKEFDVATLATGTYTLRVKGANGEASLRFVIAR